MHSLNVVSVKELFSGCLTCKSIESPYQTNCHKESAGLECDDDSTISTHDNNGGET